jgi:L-threonylcarbamoyladenylate synthase
MQRLSATALDRAVELLKAGGLVAFPTETVYGLGADASNPEAVARIFEVKGRPKGHPLIVHAASLSQAMPLASDWSDAAHALAAAFWPGPLTLELPRRTECRIDLLAGAGLDTLAVRVPAHPLALELLRAAAIPVAGPSANRSGAVSPTTAEHVLEGLSGRIAAVLDGGACDVGVESTVLDVAMGGAALLRPGGVPVEAIEAVIGQVSRPLPISAAEKTRTLRSPGMMLSHYAPNLPVRLGAAAVAANEALLAFGPALPGAGLVWQLSETRDLREAAARLFAGLRFLDAEGDQRGLARIAAMPIPEIGLGAAINDRLARAAAPRG